VPGLGGGLAAAAGAALGWGWYEAGWVRLAVRPVAVPGLPLRFAGLRIAHLSDLHLGVPSRGTHAVRRAVAWVAERDPDLTLITGDLVARPAGLPLLRELLAVLPRCYLILGNHDYAVGRDPFSARVEMDEAALAPATHLADDGRVVELRGRSVWIAGHHPSSRRAEPRLSHDADLRILLTHFPSALDRLPRGDFDLVLAGHMHDGQICVPYPGGKIRLAHPSARYTRGLYRRGGTVMHVSPGLGTTFVPFRFFARPEATELVLEPA
jgi:predicted MPP superfamily phosphohydrolase